MIDVCDYSHCLVSVCDSSTRKSGLRDVDIQGDKNQRSKGKDSLSVWGKERKKDREGGAVGVRRLILVSVVLCCLLR